MRKRKGSAHNPSRYWGPEIHKLFKKFISVTLLVCLTSASVVPRSSAGTSRSEWKQKCAIVLTSPLTEFTPIPTLLLFYYLYIKAYSALAAQGIDVPLHPNLLGFGVLAFFLYSWNAHGGLLRGEPLTTGRGPLYYLWSFRIFKKAFSGKKVLDVGTGRSRFSQVMNWLYKKSGALFVPFDIRPIAKGRNRVQGDMRKLPFASGTFDMVLSSYAFGLQPFNAETFEEFIRVAGPEGEILVGINPGDRESADELLADHPRVKSYAFEGAGLPVLHVELQPQD